MRTKTVRNFRRERVDQMVRHLRARRLARMPKKEPSPEILELVEQLKAAMESPSPPKQG